jgi:nucleolar protein 58
MFCLQVKLHSFQKFTDTADALAAATAAVEGKLGKSLKKFLTQAIVDKGLQEKLAISDNKVIWIFVNAYFSI